MRLLIAVARRGVCARDGRAKGGAGEGGEEVGGQAHTRRKCAMESWASRKGLKRSTVDACKSRKHEAVQDYAQEGTGGGKRSEAQRSTGESSDKCNGGSDVWEGLKVS